MNHPFKPYPHYKPTGIEWLGDIPKHWEVRRLRNVVSMRVSNVDKHIKEGEMPVRLCNYVDVYKNDYIDEQMDFMRATATAAEIRRFRLEKDDVLITKDSESWDDIGVPALVTKPASDLVLGYHLALFRPHANEVIGSYLLRALQSKGLAYQFHIEAKGVTRYGLSHLGIKSFRLPLPPLNEQAAIAEYLDDICGKIRRRVEAKERLIKLLEEYRRAIIHRTVTRGLDPNVEMKDSGVGWIEFIPENWNVSRSKFIFRNKSQKNFSDEPLLSVTQENGVVVRSESDMRVWNPTDNVSGYKLIEPDDFVISLRSFEGGLELSKIRGIVSPAYTVLETYKTICEHYFWWLMKSHQFIIELNKHVTGIRQGKNIGWDDFSNIYLTIPPLKEQKRISRYLDKTCAGIDASIRHARREHTLLREYRTALIAHAVTGKLDLRQAEH